MDAAEQELLTAARALVDDRVAVGVRRLRLADRDALHPSEWPAVEHAVAARQTEFAGGRVLLRRLLGQDLAFPAGSDRRPVLPPGVVASVAHDAEYAVVVLSTDPTVRAVGVDLEPATPLEREVADVVRRPDDPPVDPHLLFVVKEAVYKAWRGLGGGPLEFHDVGVSLGERDLRAVVLGGAVLHGGWAVAAGRYLACVTVGRAATGGSPGPPPP